MLGQRAGVLVQSWQCNEGSKVSIEARHHAWDSSEERRSRRRMGSMNTYLSTAWFVAQCLLAYGALILCLVLFSQLLQFFVWFFVFKIVERVVVKLVSGEQYVSAMDAVWLPHQQDLYIINSVFCFSNEGDVAQAVNNFRRAIFQRMVDARKANGKLVYPKVRCYFRPGWFQYFQREDSNFKIENHVFKWEGEVPRSKDELTTVISKLSTEPFPEERSPWCFVCIPTNFGNNDIFLLYRISHALADGVSIVKFVSHLFPDKLVTPKETRNISSIGRKLSLAKAIFIGPLLILKWFFARADQSILHGPELSGVKKFAWNEPFELQLVKDIKSATGTTVNDVLMCCLTVAFKKYLQRKGIKNPDDFTTCVAIDIRGPSSSEEFPWGNQFAFVFPKMPIATDGILKQLLETQARMKEVKQSSGALAVASTVRLTENFCPRFLSTKISSFLTRKETCIASNVPGPQNAFTVRGSLLKYAIFFPPHKENMGVGLSIFTYAGQVIIGVQGDVSVLPDPETVVEEFGNALSEMAKCVPHSNGSC